MITWLLAIILAYLFFALSGIGDKLVLAGPPKPKQYTFFVGLLSFLVVLAIPFVKFSVPSSIMFFWIIVDAIVFMMAMYLSFKAVERFEISKVAVTIGATQPIFIFVISWIFFGYQPLSLLAFLALLFLLAGSILISCDKKIEFNAKYFQLTLLSSVLYSLDYVVSKLIYNNLFFAQGFIWRGILIGFVALLFLITKKNRQEILRKQKSEQKQKRTEKIFLATQVFGGLANILQAFAISLAPVAFLPIVNSLKGLQYIFIFAITAFFSYFFPKILKEKLSKEIIYRKIFSIILIVLGLAFVVF